MGALEMTPGFAAALIVRASTLLAIALLASMLLRRSGGAARHLLWSVTMVGLLMLPVLALLLPPLPLLPAAARDLIPSAAAASDPAPVGASPAPHHDVERPDAGSATPVDRGASGTDAGVSASPPLGTREGGAARRPMSVAALLLAVWLLGAAASGLSLVRAVVAARRMRRSAVPMTSDAWRRDLADASRRLALRRPVQLLRSEQARTPLTGGILRPTIILPRAAAGWCGERRRLVLAHELVHVQRGDALRLLAARAAVALYWFQPLVWLAARNAALAREQACDEAVLSLGHRASAYARLLLDLSVGNRSPALVLGLTHRPHLEQRVMAILDPDRRPRSAGIGLIAAISMILVAVSIATAAPQTPPPPPAPPATPVAAAPVAPPATAAIGSSAAPLPPPPVRAARIAPAAPVPQATVSSCDVRGLHGNFSGSLSVRGDGARTEMVGYHDGDRVVQRYADGFRLCMRVHGPVELSQDGRVIEGMLDGGRVWIEAESATDARRLEIRGDASGLRHDYTVNGESVAFDAAASAWRDQMMSVLADYWAVGRIRGEVSSLRGEISSIRGRRSSLRGQISSIRGHVSSLRGRISSSKGRVSSLRGQISSARGRVSSMRGRISSIRGQESSMRGRLSSMQSRLSGLRSASRSTRDEQTRERLEAEMVEIQDAMAEIEQEIAAFDTEARVAEVERELASYDIDAVVAELEREIEAYGVDGRVAEIEREIEAYDADARILEVERELAALDVEGKVAEIERQIEALDADRRIEEVEARLEPALRDLLRSLGAR